MASRPANIFSSRLVSGLALDRRSKIIVYNVKKFMENEAHNGLSIPIKNFRERVLSATGISKTTYQKVLKEAGNSENPSFSNARKRRNRPCRISYNSLTPGTIDEIRNLIYDFYIMEKTRPTLKGILRKIQDKQINFKGKLTSLRQVLRKMGFRWHKTVDNKMLLMEKHDIRYKKVKFLKKLIEYRSQGKNIVYTDETYLHNTHTTPKSWSDANYDKTLKVPLAKGKRLVIVHAGNENGFVPNSLLIFKSGAKTGDYHDDMNNKNFMCWIKTQLLPNLRPNSVLVLDNASYHNVTVEKNITSANRRKDMVDYLVQHQIAFIPSATKPELYQCIRENQVHFPKKYILDELMAENGHCVLRLPPYHPELNPIEKIWATMKNRVAAQNTSFKLQDVEQLAIKNFGEIGQEDWANICAHVRKYENEQMIREGLLDHALDDMIFTVNTGSSSDSEDLDETENDDEYEDISESEEDSQEVDENEFSNN